MNSDRKAAIITGVLLIIADVFGIPSHILSKPLLDAPDYLNKIFANTNQIYIAALLVFIMAAACAGISIAMYPVLKKFNSGLALGSVGFRIIEAVFEFAGAICLLLLLTLSQEFVKAGAGDLSYFQALGGLLLAARDYIVNVIMLMSWGIAAFLYCYIFYQSKLVPRWLSGWGLVVYPLLILGSILTMFHLIIVEDTIWSVLVIPAALQEMVLAVWLIVKGFNPSAIASGSAKEDMS
jgi:hypothetical protein